MREQAGTISDLMGADAAPIRFRLLGPVEIVGAGGQPVPLRAGRQQTVLALLLLEANRVVAIDQLVDAVWGEKPPPTARSQIQICISALRRLLEDNGAGELITTRPPGYLLHVAPAQLDLLEFQVVIARAERLAKEDHLAQGAALLRQGLALWSGPALSSVTSHTVQAKAARLNEHRLNAYEDCVDWELSLGRHHDVIRELMEAVSAHPLRERLRGQLMTALYRAGRQAEALEVYRNARAELIDQLGIEPGEGLRRLESAILAQDTGLDLAEAAPDAGPHQLAAGIPDLAGRAGCVTTLVRALSARPAGPAAGVPTAVVVGRSGIGKSTLATHVAHQLAATRFPDAQLCADLRGSHPAPADPRELLESFLLALGVAPHDVPDTVEERARLYRDRLAHRRALVVLDDAADEAQVLPLLPGSAGCAVIVTSRHRLTDLPNSRLLDLPPLDAGECAALLESAVGPERVRAEPEAVASLAELTGGLPLAVRIIGARLAAHPHRTFGALNGRLADPGQCLAELTHGELSVRESLVYGYEALTPRARRLLRAVADLSSSTFPGWVAAAALDIGTAVADGFLEQLVDARMLEPVGTGGRRGPRYRLAPLDRVFAREKRRRDSDSERLEALERTCQGWLALTDHARRQLGCPPQGPDGTPRWEPPGGFRVVPMTDPLEWLGREHGNLAEAVAESAAAGLPDLSDALAANLEALLAARDGRTPWRTAPETGPAAADRTAPGAPPGSLHAALRHVASATDLLNRALQESGGGETEAVPRRPAAGPEPFARPPDDFDPTGSQPWKLAALAGELLREARQSIDEMMASAGVDGPFAGPGTRDLLRAQALLDEALVLCGPGALAGAAQVLPGEPGRAISRFEAGALLPAGARRRPRPPG